MKLKDTVSTFKFDPKKKAEKRKIKFTETESNVDTSWNINNDVAVRGSRYLWYLLGITFIFFLATLSVMFYIYLSGTDNTISTEKIAIVIQGPTVLDSGSNGVFEIRIANRNPVDLNNVLLVVQYPKGTFSPDNSIALKRQEISLGTLISGEIERKNVSATFFGLQEQVLELKFDVVYRPDGSSRDVSVRKEHDITIRSTPIIIGKPEISDASIGKEVTFTIPVKSVSQDTVPEILVDIKYPNLFKITSVSPVIDNPENGEWRLTNIKPNETRNIVIKGYLGGIQDSEQSMTVNAYITPKKGGEESVLISSENIIFVLEEGFVNAFVRFNGDYGSDIVVDSGNTIRGEIVVENTDSDILNNVQIYLSLIGSGLDVSSIRSDEAFYDEINQRLVWDFRRSPDLKQIKVGGRERFSFSFKTLPNLLEFEDANKSIKGTVSIVAQRLSTGQSDELPNVASSTAIIQSDIQVVGNSLYSASRIKNIGPYPPKAGFQTTYVLQYFIKNSGNDLSSVQLEVPILLPAEFTGVVNGLKKSEYAFDQENNIISINIPYISALGSQSSRVIEIQVVLTPTTPDIGDKLTLTNEARFRAFDTFTKQNVRKIIAPLSTFVSNEIQDYSGGVVQE